MTFINALNNEERKASLQQKLEEGKPYWLETLGGALCAGLVLKAGGSPLRPGRIAHVPARLPS